jgi:ABC-type antimicrobial peptide transport system permease subunit
MGIRLALGATGRDVIDLVVRYGLVLAVVGVALGTAVALALSRLVEQLVWGVETNDPMTFVGTALVLVLAALAASFVPAWRASRSDPLQTLRAE